jgi:cytochrome b involved in lipid metabolism
VTKVSGHATKADCWIILDTGVYDITSYISQHPGGNSPVRFCGKDTTAIFDRIHSDAAKELKDNYRIGNLAK